MDLGRHLRGRQVNAWKEAELSLLGKMPDARVAKNTGRTPDAVRQKREELRIPNPTARPRKPKPALLTEGEMGDSEEIAGPGDADPCHAVPNGARGG